MAIPPAAASIVAERAGASAWELVHPLVFVAFAIVEVVRWAVGLIAAAFVASREGGFAVLASYFICLATTFFSLVRVGHAPP